MICFICFTIVLIIRIIFLIFLIIALSIVIIVIILFLLIIIFLFSRVPFLCLFFCSLLLLIRTLLLSVLSNNMITITVITISINYKKIRLVFSMILNSMACISTEGGQTAFEVTTNEAVQKLLGNALAASVSSSTVTDRQRLGAEVAAVKVDHRCIC